MTHETTGANVSNHPTLRSYVIGYCLSIALTGIAFALTASSIESQEIDRLVLISALTTLAVAQLIVQIIFFLHLNSESKKRWNLIVFSFAVLFVIVIVVGSLWIMNNLKHGLQTDMFEEENIHPSALGH